MTVPERAAVALRTYLTRYRPVLATDRSPPAQVWLARTGAPYAPYKRGERIATLTRRRLGIAVAAHRFRLWAATTIAERAPDEAAIIRPLLGHATMKVADRAYNQATFGTALLDYWDVLEGVGEES